MSIANESQRKRKNMTKLSESKPILLFRFHKDIEQATERLKTLRHFNPDLLMYALFGGTKEDFDVAERELKDLVGHVWFFASEKDPAWKWFHTDLMTKAWFKDFGHTLDFDFLYSYEYDLLTLKPLNEIYPDVDTNTLVLAAVTKLDDVEWTWSWTGQENKRPNWLQFQAYMQKTYGLERQKYVCLGPGPLLPRTFIEKFAAEPDVEWSHEEITLPAYAEVFGFKLADHGMHPGFEITPDERFFSCRDDYKVTTEIIEEQLKLPDGKRAFHPVKHVVTIDEISSMLS